MNDFERVAGCGKDSGLYSAAIDTIQVNLGLKCNQQCAHCHLKCSPKRTEMMSWPVMEKVIDAAALTGCSLVDITGGAPEMNPHFRDLILRLRKMEILSQVRTNLTVMFEPGNEVLPEFFRDNEVQLVASMPCYLEENVEAQRGAGVHQKSIEAMQKLNSAGYGKDPNLPLRLVYNPGGAFLPSDQTALEADYRKQLEERFGIVFNSLITITNVPIGRFLSRLTIENKFDEYMGLLKDSFNAGTLEKLMCRRQISVGWDGTLYDCDFNLALGCAVDHGAPDHIDDFDFSALEQRRIVTGDHCFCCTAGHGSSCGGALV
jgi:radical SAM/Cys-rich protein